MLPMNTTEALDRLVTYPNWRDAKPGQRVRMVGTGATGTVERVNPTRGSGWGMRVRWDNGHSGRVVSVAFMLEPIECRRAPSGSLWPASSPSWDTGTPQVCRDCGQPIVYTKSARGWEHRR